MRKTANMGWRCRRNGTSSWTSRRHHGRRWVREDGGSWSAQARGIRSLLRRGIVPREGIIAYRHGVVAIVAALGTRY